MKYRRKPIIIEAVQFNGTNHHQLADWSSEAVQLTDKDTIMLIKTLEGDMIATVGDYIVKGIKGEFYAVKPDIFFELHEEV